MILLPDSAVITTELNTIAGWALGLAFLCCILAIGIGGVRWAVGASQQEPEQIAAGRRQILIALAGAFLCGAASAYVGFLLTIGAGPTVPYRDVVHRTPLLESLVEPRP